VAIALPEITLHSLFRYRQVGFLIRYAGDMKLKCCSHSPQSAGDYLQKYHQHAENISSNISNLQIWANTGVNKMNTGD
jgi:hypothetical protein